MKIKFIYFICLTVLFLSSSNALAAKQEDFAAIREEWNREVLSNLDKAYTIYVGMPYKELQTNFAKAGWNIKKDMLITGSPAIKLTKNFREIVVWGDSSTEIEGFDIIFYTSNRTTAVLMYNDAKKMLEKYYGVLKDNGMQGGVHFYDEIKQRGYEVSIVDNVLSYKQAPRFNTKPELGKEYEVVIIRKYSRDLRKIFQKKF